MAAGPDQRRPRPAQPGEFRGTAAGRRVDAIDYAASAAIGVLGCSRTALHVTVLYRQSHHAGL